MALLAKVQFGGRLCPHIYQFQPGRLQRQLHPDDGTAWVPGSRSGDGRMILGFPWSLAWEIVWAAVSGEQWQSRLGHCRIQQHISKRVCSPSGARLRVPRCRQHGSCLAVGQVHHGTISCLPAAKLCSARGACCQ